MPGNGPARDKAQPTEEIIYHEDIITFEQFNQLIGLPEYDRLEERYKA